MIDLSMLSAAERRGLQGTLRNNFKGYTPAIEFLTKIGQAFRVKGLTHIVYPGWGGVDVAQFRPRNRSIAARDVFTYRYTCELQDIDASYSYHRSQIADSEDFADVPQEVSEQIFPSIVDTIHAGTVEYITETPGEFGVLDPATPVVGFDNLPTYDTNHFGGLLDNQRIGTGVLVNNVINDFWRLLQQLRAGRIPGTNRFYWGGVDKNDLDFVILFPLELEEVMNNAFGTDIFPAMVGGTAYNAPADNILSKMGFKGARPILIPSPYLSQVATPAVGGTSATNWYLFITARGVSPSSQAISYFFNAGYSTKGQKGKDREAKEITFGGIEGSKGELFTLQWLGEGSDSWVKDDLAILAAKSTWIPFCANVYRAGMVLN